LLYIGCKHVNNLNKWGNKCGILWWNVITRNEGKWHWKENWHK
jgi:hypothetical protein